MSEFGIGFFGGLTLLLIAAKLWGKIDLSWFWVLSPIWIPLLVCILFVLVAVAILLCGN